MISSPMKRLACSTPATRTHGFASRCSSPTANRSARTGSRFRHGERLHLRFNDLTDPEPVPRDTSYASLIEADVPIVVQHTRLDSRNPSIALLSTVAFAC